MKALRRPVLADPRAVAERVFVSCGVYESLIYENRGSGAACCGETGMEVRFDETRDGHNWENWRDASARPCVAVPGP